MLKKRNRKQYRYTYEWFEKNLLKLEGTEHISHVECIPSRNLVAFHTVRLCINENVDETLEGSESQDVTVDFHYYDCGEIGGGWPHPAAAHFKKPLTAKEIQAKVLEMPGGHRIVRDWVDDLPDEPNEALINAAKRLKDVVRHDPTRKIDDLPQPAEPSMNLLVDETVYPFEFFKAKKDRTKRKDRK